MILGFDATTLVGHISGVGYYTHRLLQSLANGAGHGVVERLVVFSNREPSVPMRPGVELFRGARFRIRSAWMQILLPGILRRVRPDLVHFTNYLAPLAGDIPFVVSFHDMSLSVVPQLHTLKKRLLTASLLPYVARKARRILAPSESTRRDVIRVLGVDPGRVRVVPYAGDELFRPAQEGPERLARDYGVRQPYFLYVGTLEPRKNLARALRAFARVVATLPEHSFVLVGQKGWKYQDVFEAAALPALAGRVRFLGYVPEPDLPLLYTHALASVYPSLYEGFGFPVVEAMGCGTPVLTSRSSSLVEIAEGAAVLVDPLDEQALADALLALATDTGLRRDLSKKGLARASTFSWERTGRETVSLYQEVYEEIRAARP